MKLFQILTKEDHDAIINFVSVGTNGNKNDLHFWVDGVFSDGSWTVESNSKPLFGEAIPQVGTGNCMSVAIAYDPGVQTARRDCTGRTNWFYCEYVK